MDPYKYIVLIIENNIVRGYDYLYFLDTDNEKNKYNGLKNLYKLGK